MKENKVVATDDLLRLIINDRSFLSYLKDYVQRCIIPGKNENCQHLLDLSRYDCFIPSSLLTYVSSICEAVYLKNGHTTQAASEYFKYYLVLSLASLKEQLIHIFFHTIKDGGDKLHPFMYLGGEKIGGDVQVCG